LRPVDARAFGKEKTRLRRDGLFLFLRYERLAIRTAAALEAIAAVDRLVATRDERHFGRFTALAARGLVHFTGCSAAAACAARAAVATVATTTAAAAAGGLAGRAAIRATIRLVLEAFARKELLLARAKRKGRAAINAI
jgi:hypothetical protein